VSRVPQLGRKGFIAVVAFILLVILGILGISYWSISRLSTDQILKEAHRIKARSIAQAGIEKVLVHVMNQYRLRNYDLEYPGSKKYVQDRQEKEFKREVGDGYYQVELIQAYEPPSTNAALRNRVYAKNRVPIGIYDVWRVVVVGVMPTTNVQARVETLVKVIRQTVQY